MVKTVKDQLEKDRIEAIKERERRRKIQIYHKKILSQAVIPEDQAQEMKEAISAMSDNDTQSLQGMIENLKRFNVSSASLKDQRSISTVTSPRKATPILPPLTGSLKGEGVVSSGMMNVKPGGEVIPRKGIISMSGALGGKVKPFGAQNTKIKRTKRKKKKRATLRK